MLDDDPGRPPVHCAVQIVCLIISLFGLITCCDSAISDVCLVQASCIFHSRCLHGYFRFYITSVASSFAAFSSNGERVVYIAEIRIYFPPFIHFL